MNRTTNLALASLAALLGSNVAHAYDTSELNALMYMDGGDPVVAYVEMDPDAPVTGVSVWSPDCDFGAAVQVDDGLWMAEATPDNGWICWTATASIDLSESREAPFCGPFIGTKKVSMSGSSYSDSYVASAAAYSPETAGDEGHVCSNGEIKMSGSSTIYGDALAGIDEEVSTSGSAGVTGYVGNMNVPIELEPVDPGTAPFDNDNHTIEPSLEGKQPLSAKGEFKLSGGDHADLKPGTYFFSKFVLSGGSTVGIHGPTVIYTTGDFDASGGSIVNDRLVPSDVRIYSMGSKVKISGDSASYGLVYAPSAKIERSGDSDYFGSLIGKELVLSGSGGIHYGGGFTETAPVTVTIDFVHQDG